MHVIGLTGGIASGKSTISRFFVARDVPVIDADVLGHRTYEPGTEPFRALVDVFGREIIAPDGSVDRRALGARVFGQPDEMKRLTDIVWPAIRRLAGEELSGLEVAGNNVALLEAAVLLEARWDDIVDEVWVVIVDLEIAIQRLATRNGFDETAARARIASQLSNVERAAKADVLIENNGTLDELQHAIQEAWDSLQRRLAATTAAGR